MHCEWLLHFTARGQVMMGSGYGLLGDLALGIVGAVIGGWLLGAIAPSAEPTGFVGLLIVATVAAIGLIAIARIAGRRPARG